MCRLHGACLTRFALCPEVLEALNIKSRFNLLGHSMGGLMATVFAVLLSAGQSAAAPEAQSQPPDTHICTTDAAPTAHSAPCVDMPSWCPCARRVGQLLHDSGTLSLGSCSCCVLQKMAADSMSLCVVADLT